MLLLNYLLKHQQIPIYQQPLSDISFLSISEMLVLTGIHLQWLIDAGKVSVQQYVCIYVYTYTCICSYTRIYLCVYIFHVCVLYVFLCLCILYTYIHKHTAINTYIKTYT